MISVQKRGKAVRKSRVQTVLRVSAGERYLGDVLLDARGRVWRKAGPIPADVVLKALLAFSRQGEVCGELVGRLDGRTYVWFVVGALPLGEAGPGGEAVGELLSAA